MNQLQKFFLQNPRASEILYKILGWLHPDLSEEEKAAVTIVTKYDWICFKSKKVDIGIEFNHGLWGPYATLKDFKRARHKKNFKIWRMVWDSKYDPNIYLDDELSIEALQVIMKGVPKPTAEEMFEYYYRD